MFTDIFTSRVRCRGSYMKTTLIGGIILASSRISNSFLISLRCFSVGSPTLICPGPLGPGPLGQIVSPYTSFIRKNSPRMGMFSGGSETPSIGGSEIRRHIYVGRRNLETALRMGSKLRSSQISSYVPKTENQKQYVSLLDNAENKVVVVLGPAGTGKTLFACLKAIKDLKAGVINRIVITRPVVPVEEEDIGFLPGNLRNKMDPWIRPIFDIFLEFYSQRDIDTMVKTGVIEIAPLAFMRGRTFKRCFILADEMQNSSPSQMLMLMTRIGEGSRMVVGGDLHQSDRKLLGSGSGSGSGANGLSDFLSRYTIWIERNKDSSQTKEGTREGTQEGTHLAVCELSIADVERSPVVSQILDIFSDVSYLPDSGELLAEDRSSGSSGLNEKKTATYYNGIPGVNLAGQVENDSALIPKKDFYNKFGVGVGGGVGKEDL